MLQYLALLPVFHFIMLFTLSNIHETYGLMKSKYSIMYLDWVFVPFNYLIPLGVNFSLQLFSIIALIVFIVTVFLHMNWHSTRTDQAHYFFNKHGLTQEGGVHFIFMTVQTALVITVLLSNPISPYYGLMLACLFAYLGGYILIVKYVRKVSLRSRAELPFLIVGIFVVIVRLIVW